MALHEGRPVVTGGVVELWHPSCWQTRHARGVEEVAIVLPPKPSYRRHAGIVAGALAVAAAFVAHHTVAPSASLAAIAIDDNEKVAIHALQAVHEEAPPAPPAPPAPIDAFPVPTVNGQPLNELFPSLLDWTHPVTGSAELMPEQPSRHFGAERIGVERPECGGGHCGIDLDGPRGRPIVAVADGTVVRVERHELGLDGRSGRYVRIEHDDGTLTAYMHLDDIVDGLEVGDHVDGGQLIGTLGATAVYNAAPHLHFSLEVPNHPGKPHARDNTDTHYVDPAPFLVRSTIVPVPERRHPVKPAM